MKAQIATLGQTGAQLSIVPKHFNRSAVTIPTCRFPSPKRRGPSGRVSPQRGGQVVTDRQPALAESWLGDRGREMSAAMKPAELENSAIDFSRAFDGQRHETKCRSFQRCAGQIRPARAADVDLAFLAHRLASRIQ
jgi:hypothetical protein